MFAKVANVLAAALQPGGRRSAAETAFNIVGHSEFETGGWRLRLILKIGGGPSAGCKGKLDKKEQEERKKKKKQLSTRLHCIAQNTPPPLMSTHTHTTVCVCVCFLCKHDVVPHWLLLGYKDLSYYI